jgi:murein hydrolase activator
MMFFIKGNMRSYLIFILVTGFFFSLSAQDLSNKKKQLEDLQEAIKRQNEIIEEKEKEKFDTIGNLELKRQKKQEIDSKIQKLSDSEKKVQQTLNETILKIDRVELDLLNLYLLCEKEFKDLMLLHYNVENDADNEIRKEYLAIILNHTLDEIYSTQETKDFLEIDKKDKRYYFANVISEKESSKKKKTEFESEISYIQEDLTRLDAEKKELEERKIRLEEEAAALDELIAKLQSELTVDYFSYEFSSPRLNWPVEGEIIRSFGEHKSEEYKVSLMNHGIDIAVNEGTAVKAIDAGVVAFAEWYSGSGKLVIINHQNGYYSLYSHNSNLLVSKGDRIKKDQTIALSGKTGSTDIPCLHFEIRKHGDPVDPLDFLK